MKEYNLNEVEEKPEAIAKISVWTKITRALLSDVKIEPQTLCLTTKQEKVLTEVHDILFKEIKFPRIHNILFKEVHLFGKNKEV